MYVNLEVLKLKPIKNKKVSVYLIERPKESINLEKKQCIIDFLLTKKIDFISIDLEDKDLKSFRNTSIVKIIEELKVPYFPVAIPEYAKGYLYEEISQKEEQLNELLEEYLTMKDCDSIKGQNLKSWFLVLEEEIREKKKLLNLKIKPMWIVKKVLDVIKAIETKEVQIVHLSQADIFLEVATLFKDLNIEVIALQRTDEFVAFSIITNQEEIEEWKY